jgi:hypothetical protein
MIVLKIIMILLLIMPFLFVVGTIASSADLLGPISVSGANIQSQGIARFGSTLKSATGGFVAIEIDILKRFFAYLETRLDLNRINIPLDIGYYLNNQNVRDR